MEYFRPIRLFCVKSLVATRLISLTDPSVCQSILLGGANVVCGLVRALKMGEAFPTNFLLVKVEESS